MALAMLRQEGLSALVARRVTLLHAGFESPVAGFGGFIVNYSSGTIVTVLGAPNGLSKPVAAVEQPNAVY
jgi:hypothetical protein